MAEMYYEEDADLSLIQDKNIGISVMEVRDMHMPLTLKTPV